MVADQESVIFNSSVLSYESSHVSGVANLGYLVIFLKWLTL